MRAPIFFAAALASVAAASAAFADGGFFGTSGLFLAPTAEARPRGAAAIGANYVNAEFRRGVFAGSSGNVAQYVSVSILDNVECSAALTNLQGRLGVQRQSSTVASQDGWNVDRSFHVHALVHQGRLGTPSFAVGARDVFGDAVRNRSFYAVGTQGLGPVRLSLGYGSQALGGVFAGLAVPFGFGKQAIVEHVDGHTNLGIRWQMWGGLQADVALMGARSLGGGLSWHRNL